MKEDERIARLRQVWLQQRPKEKATENDVIAFYGWLEHNRPELLSRRNGDPYWNLKRDLQNHVCDHGHAYVTRPAT